MIIEQQRLQMVTGTTFNPLSTVETPGAGDNNSPMPNNGLQAGTRYTMQSTEFVSQKSINQVALDDVYTIGG